MKKSSLTIQRSFSEELRKELVSHIETGRFTVSQVTREYGVSSRAVYNWLYKYSRSLKKGTRIVMEKDSVDKAISELQKQIRELEAALGRKSLESDLYKTIVDLASKEYKTDLKKNFGDKLSSDSKKEK
jgi:transposase-like protein